MRRNVVVVVVVIVAAVVAVGVVAVVVGSEDDGPERAEQVDVGQEPEGSAEPTVPADEDPFAVQDALAWREVAGVGDRFVVVRGGRVPTLSVLEPSGETVAEVAVPVAGGTGLARPRMVAVAEDQVLLTGVQCATVREETDLGVLCDPGDGFVATFALEPQEWAVVPGAVDPGDIQELLPIGVHDGRAVVRVSGDVATVDLATGAAEPLPPGGGPTEGGGPRCLADGVVIRGDTYSSPSMSPPGEGAGEPYGDEPFPRFGASTFDLATGSWGPFVPAPVEFGVEDATYYLHCVGDGVVALPGEPVTLAGEPVPAFRFSPGTGRWQEIPTQPHEEPSGQFAVDAPKVDVVAVVTVEPEVGGQWLGPDDRWRGFPVDISEPQQAAATETHVAILGRDDTLVIEALS